MGKANDSKYKIMRAVDSWNIGSMFGGIANFFGKRSGHVPRGAFERKTGYENVSDADLWSAHYSDSANEDIRYEMIRRSRTGTWKED